MEEHEERSWQVVEKIGQGLLAMWPYIFETPPDAPELWEQIDPLKEMTSFFVAQGILPGELPPLLDGEAALERAREQLPELTGGRLHHRIPELAWSKGIHYWTLYFYDAKWEFVEVDMVTGQVVGVGVSRTAPEYLDQPLSPQEALDRALAFAEEWPDEKLLLSDAEVQAREGAGWFASSHYQFAFLRVVEDVVHETDVLQVAVDPRTGEVVRHRVLRWDSWVKRDPVLSPEEILARDDDRYQEAHLVVVWSERIFEPVLAYRLDDAVYRNAHNGIKEGRIPPPRVR